MCVIDLCYIAPQGVVIILWASKLGFLTTETDANTNINNTKRYFTYLLKHSINYKPFL